MAKLLYMARVLAAVLIFLCVAVILRQKYYTDSVEKSVSFLGPVIAPPEQEKGKIHSSDRRDEITTTIASKSKPGNCSYGIPLQS